MERTVIALGFFDGVHRGHGALLQKTAERACALGAEPAVFTFDRPPKEVVTGQPVYLINSPEDRADLARRICAARSQAFLSYDTLRRLGIVLKRAQYFITCKGKYYGATTDPVRIRQLLLARPSAQTAYEPMSLF